MTITAYRRVTQIAFLLLVFLVPVLNIFRYDTATRELIVLGHVWGIGLKAGFYNDRSVTGTLHVAVQFLLKAILPWLLALAVFPLLGIFTGRFFCGWLCPEGTLFELSDFLTLRLAGRRSLLGRSSNDPYVEKANRSLYWGLAMLSVLVIPLCGAVALTGYFVAPSTLFAQIIHGELSFGVKAAIIGISIYMLITSIFVRHALCKFVCAAGLMQMLCGWVSPSSLRVHMDVSRAKECTNCRRCETACFMKISPRKNRRDISCVNCGACIQACRHELGNERGLFAYRFGGGQETDKELTGNKELRSR